MPGKTSTRKTANPFSGAALLDAISAAAPEAASVPTQAEANAVADTIAEAAEKMAEMKAEFDALPAPAPIDREAARAAKVKAACEADYRVQAVQAHAEQNYNEGGWDVVLETMNAVDIYWVVYKARSSKGAIARMAEHIGAYADHRAEIVSA